MKLDKEQITKLLSDVMDPDLGKDLVTLGMVKEIKIEDLNVHLNIELTTPACPLKDKIRGDIEAAVLTGFPKITLNVEFSAQVRQSLSVDKNALSGIKNIIAVASGKGGVGKSTVASNLALAYSRFGAKVGLLDLDIYGPSQPTIFGIQDSKPRVIPSGQIIPIEKWGVHVMSVGFFVDHDAAVIWRGPMINKLINQFFNDCLWDNIDYLIIDLPPGTGDAQISISQMAPITGAIMVTTPQTVSVIDVVRSIEMFKKVNIPVFGVVENMNSFECPKCGHQENIFDGSGGKALSESYEIDFYGTLPIIPKLREGADFGKPLILEEPEHPISLSFNKIAEKIASRLSISSFKVDNNENRVGL